MSAPPTVTSGQAGRMALANLLSSSPSPPPSLAPVPAAVTPFTAQHTPGASPTEMDESELIAAAALRGMRHASDSSSLRSVQPTPALSLASSTSYSTLSDAAAVHDRDLDLDAPVELSVANNNNTNNKNFVTRVSAMPLVGTALRAYESGKNSSRVVKYAAQTVESSVMTISRPVIGRLPVNQLDEFACRTLDRWTPKSPKTSSPTPERDATSPMALDADQDRGRTADRRGTQGRRAESAMSASPARPLGQNEQRSSGATPVADDSQPGTSGSVTADQQAVAVRSTWQAMLTEAGGISAAVSEESMKRLKYCLQWLQYATARIDHQMLILREFIAKITPPDAGDVVVSAQHMRTLQNVKQDVVQTIREVVDVVSKYAGGALPEPAKATVRAFILHLPQRWATRMQGAPGTGAASVPSTPGASGDAGSPTAALDAQQQQQLAVGGAPTAGVASAAAHRILGLASESLDMMRSVTGVFKDSLDRAETWVERLRVVGIQRQQQQQQQQQQLAPLAPAYRSHPPSEAGDYDDAGTSSPVSARLSPNPSFKQLAPSGGSSGSLGASLDALSLAALHHHQQHHHQQGYQRASGPRFTVGPSSGAMDVDDD